MGLWTFGNRSKRFLSAVEGRACAATRAGKRSRCVEVLSFEMVGAKPDVLNFSAGRSLERVKFCLWMTLCGRSRSHHIAESLIPVYC
ncbi:MAG: hypothetical protein WBL95_19570 [Microcoleus sp.]